MSNSKLSAPISAKGVLETVRNFSASALYIATFVPATLLAAIFIPYSFMLALTMTALRLSTAALLFSFGQFSLAGDTFSSIRKIPSEFLSKEEGYVDHIFTITVEKGLFPVVYSILKTTLACFNPLKSTSWWKETTPLWDNTNLCDNTKALPPSTPESSYSKLVVGELLTKEGLKQHDGSTKKHPALKFEDSDSDNSSTGTVEASRSMTEKPYLGDSSGSNTTYLSPAP